MSEATRSAEARGKNVEDAIQKGLAQLGVRRDQVDITVLTEGSRGILGIGAEDARVRLTVLVVAPPPTRQAEAVAPRPAAPLPPPVEAWDEDDPSTLGDLIVAAVRDANKKVAILTETSMPQLPDLGGLTGQ